MRCSVCFAEMKQGPNGLECLVCDTQLEPLFDESDSSPGILNTYRFFTRDVAILVATLVVGLFFWGIIVFAPGDSREAERETRPKTVSDAMALVDGDESAIIVQALEFVEGNSIAMLMRDKGCQRVSADAAETIQWLTLLGDPLSDIRPAFPGNWRMHEICPMADGGAAIATLLNDGVALSQVGDRGALLWTQIVSASNPDPDRVVLVENDQDLLLITHNSEAGQVLLASFGPSGSENWKQALMAATSIESVGVTKTSLGDLLIAWREPAFGVRFVIVSTTGLVIQDFAIEDRLLPLKGAVQDEVGRTLTLLGGEEVAIDLIAQTGVSERLKSLASSAVPLGVITYEGAFYIFAASPSSLLVWGMDPLGNISERLTIEIEAAIETGTTRRINEVEAIVSLRTEDESALELVIDLRRLSNALEYNTLDSAFDISSLNELAAAGAVDTVSDAVENVEASTPELREAPEALISAEILDVSGNASVDELIPEDVLITEDVLESPPDASNSSPTIPPTIEAAETQIEEETISVGEPITVPPPSSQQVRCTFSCISSNEPIAEYVLMQTVDRSEGESLTDVSLRLNDTHVNLCTLSGGEPEPSFARACTPG